MSRAGSRNPLLPKALRNPALDAFTTDRLCPRCEYNLRGMKPGMNCPECGLLILTAAKASIGDESLTAAPRWYLKTLAYSLCGCAFSAFCGILALLQPRPQSINWVIILGVIAACGWNIGVWFASQPKPLAVVQKTPPRVQMRHARWLARLSQLGWLALPLGIGLSAHIDAAAMQTAATTGAAFLRPHISTYLLWCAWLGGLIAIFGMLVVCYVLADLAEWASDSALAERFNLAGLGLPLGTPVAIGAWYFFGAFGPLTLIAVAAGILGGVAVLLSMGVLAMGVGQLAYLAVWAVKNKQTQAESADLRDRREREYDQEMIDRLDPTPIAPEHGVGEAPPLHELALPALSPPDPADQPLIVPANEHIIERSAKPMPYELAGDDDQPSRR
ncbi:MAG TPA: hypothetical protein VK176_02975 [Phycisphaerales bacterium]|nr:hypothetical protein [Phycisphaerales bacterium]